MSKRDRRGQGVMEYGLILVLIGIAAMATSENLRKRISDFFFATSDKVETVGEPEPSAAPADPPSPTP